MESLNLITEQLRINLINFFREKKAKFDSMYFDDEDGEELEDENTCCDETDTDDLDDEEYDMLADEEIDYNSSRFNEEVEMKLVEEIRKSDYKKIIYLILLEDIYEACKSRQILNENLADYEKNYINLLEGASLKDIFNCFEKDDEFLLDTFSLFYGYNISSSIEDRYKNRKLIELAGNYSYLEKFSVHTMDDAQYEYYKRRN